LFASGILCPGMEEVSQRIRIDDERGFVLLPLDNFLRLSIVRLNPLVHDFLKESSTSDVVSFFEWLRVKLGVKLNDKILL
jgi:hypothetical protein